MRLLVAGVSHKTAPIEVRESLAVAETRLPALLRTLRSLPGVTEAMVLSTCNRVEFALTSQDDADPFPALQDIIDPPHTLGPQLYQLHGVEAVQHLFRVAASLDSMVVGEPQILGQMKSAYSTAKSEGTINGLLDQVMTRAFGCAKRVRSETGIGLMAVSISYAAVELARKIFGDLNGRKIMLVGSGKMSQLAAKHLRRSGASHIFVTNRTEARAREMAELFQGTPVEYSRFLGILPEIDILIVSSAAPHYILSKEDMQRVIATRKNRPMFLIDISVPRNIDPAVDSVDNAFLYDIDNLQGVVTANLRERQKEAERGEEIVRQEAERTMARMRVQDVAPTIVSLQEQLESIRATEYARTLRKLGPLTSEQQQALEAMTRSIVNKIAHGPISELRRQSGQPDGEQVVDTIRKAFQLRAD
jgi:glutamyl-tRNA reductase